MYQYYNNNNSQQNPLQKKVKKLEEEKQILSKSITELTSCYEEKINIMEDTIRQQQQRTEELLVWKQQYIDKNLFQVDKYEVQIKKMIQILDNVHRNFEKEKKSLEEHIKVQQGELDETREENQMLRHHHSESELKIEDLVKNYTEEIEKLKLELREIREQSNLSSYSQEQNEEDPQPLKDISYKSNSHVPVDLKCVTFNLEAIDENLINL